jgi:hypothetical protein
VDTGNTDELLALQGVVDRFEVGKTRELDDFVSGHGLGEVVNTLEVLRGASEFDDDLAHGVDLGCREVGKTLLEVNDLVLGGDEEVGSTLEDDLVHGVDLGRLEAE